MSLIHCFPSYLGDFHMTSVTHENKYQRFPTLKKSNWQFLDSRQIALIYWLCKMRIPVPCANFHLALIIICQLYTNISFLNYHITVKWVAIFFQVVGWLLVFKTKVTCQSLQRPQYTKEKEWNITVIIPNCRVIQFIYTLIAKYSIKLWEIFEQITVAMSRCFGAFSARKS